MPGQSKFLSTKKSAPANYFLLYFVFTANELAIDVGFSLSEYLKKFCFVFASVVNVLCYRETRN